MGGDTASRFYLGIREGVKEGNWERALKHYMIATRSGCNDSLDAIQGLYSSGNATKEDYTKALRLYQEYLMEIKSEQRDEAAAFNREKYRYY